MVQARPFHVHVSPLTFAKLRLPAPPKRTATPSFVSNAKPNSPRPEGPLTTLSSHCGSAGAAFLLPRESGAPLTSGVPFDEAVTAWLADTLRATARDVWRDEWSSALLLGAPGFGGMTVRAVLHPDAARVLVFEGPPRTQLGLLGVLFVPLLKDIVDRFAPLAAERGVRIAADLDPRVRARVDAGALRQMVTNLLDNALKYGPMGQTVRVKLEVDGREARIAVADQGPGIAAGDREVIWRRSVRLAGSHGPHPGAAATTGTGIGLSVVRDLAIAHGGRAWVDGAAGGGATFVVALPSVEQP